jgi:1-acyl-sn-glycerol-3-phosphate acyltransferase
MAGMKDAPAMYRGLRWSLPKVLIPYLKMSIEGAENIPVDQPYIVAANHLSFIDSIVLPISMTRPIYYLAKADYFDSWRTRWFFRGVGCVPTKRDAGEGRGALETGVEILRSGDPVGIYPEGTRSPDGRLYRGKTGPVRMALEADVPIIPIGIEGTDKAMPTGARGLVRHPVTVRIGEPLDLSRYRDQREDPFVLRAATDELMFEIMMLSGQEYVDEYASKVKRGEVDVKTVRIEDLPPVAEAVSESEGEPIAPDGRAAG